MTRSLIGWWTQRPGGGHWHLVESQVADRLVTRCGRELQIVVGGVSLRSVAHLEPRERPNVCRYCGWR